MGGHGGLVDLGDVGRHLGDDRYLDIMLHVGRVEQHQLRVLSHVAAHASQLHLRAGEIQLHRVDAGLFSHFRQRDPLRLGVAHDGGHDDFVGIVLFQPQQNVEVHLHGILAQLLHVAEAEEIGAARLVDGIEARRHLADVLHADGLVEHACPSCFEGTRHHLVVGADGRRGEEEGILARDAAEVDGKAGEVFVWLRAFDGFRQFPDADRPVVVDAGRFGGLQLGVAA